MTYVTLFNGFEAALWSVLAVIVAAGYRRSPTALRRVARGASVFLVLFAVSDLVEMQTGAWWRPTGLLLFKGGCVIGLIFCFAKLIRAARPKKAEPDDAARP